MGVCKKDWNDKRKADPTLGTKRNKAKFDEFIDEKYLAKLEDNTYKPWDDMLDLLKVLVMELGLRFGIRGKEELVYLMWNNLKLDKYEQGQHSGLKYVTIAPGGGFDKTHINVQFGIQ